MFQAVARQSAQLLTDHFIGNNSPALIALLQSVKETGKTDK